MSGVEQIAPQLFTATNGHCGSLHYKVQCSSDGAELSTSEWSPKVEAAGDGDGVPELKEQRTVAHLNA